LVAKKFTAITYLSGELDEDSIISIRPYIEGKIAKAYVELLDKVMINGDTTSGATGNVNLDDATPTA
jgi:HK97 family phage major capsid protein